MIGGVAEHMFDDHAAPKIMADRVFLGHADAAVQLDRVLCDKAAGLADPDLGDRDVMRFWGVCAGQPELEANHGAAESPPPHTMRR